LGLSKRLGEKHSPVGEDWSCDGTEIEFGRREWEGREQR